MKQSLPPQLAVPVDEAEGEGMFWVKHSDFQLRSDCTDCTRLRWQVPLPGRGE